MNTEESQMFSPKVVEGTEKQHMAETLKQMNLDTLNDGFPLFINHLSAVCRLGADTWYFDAKTGARIYPNIGERCMLMVSEISEGFEAYRKNRMDDHLPHRPGIEAEMADAMIRILDFCGEHQLDIGGAFWEKIGYNLRRLDHKPESRVQPDGKKY